MTSERWQQIERIYHAARELDAGARAQFLLKACGEDAELRREVESLLVQADQHESFLQTPAIEVAVESMAKEEQLSNPLNPVLEIGTMIAHYRLTEKIGEGGMGEVYRALDTKLQRDVALKILPEAMARDAQRMARFEREAQVLASLNHPNIAAIHGLEESNGVHALVMELVEGKTLGAKIVGEGSALPREPKGLPYQDALPIARQMAEALEYAHERGVVHRDLKPANVKITPEGTVKVLDFGLAKVMSPQDPSTLLDPKNSPSLSAMATQAGMILGTAAYMSPEQAKGQRVDRRCDIWAFGCVLFEMLSGRKAFEGETISDVLAAVIKSDPDWNALPGTIPPRVQDLIHRCLQKDQRQRLQAIGDARIAIEETISGTGVPPVVEHGQDAHATKPLRRALPWVLTSILAVVVFAFVAAHFRREPQQQASIIRFSVPMPENTTVPVSRSMSLSPDGRHLAFVLKTGPNAPNVLWVHSFDALAARPIQGTEGAYLPFWSPDASHVGFFASGKLQKVAVSGGLPQTLCEATGIGATWSRDGVIVFTNRWRLYRVPATGGTPTLAGAPDAARHEGAYLLPQFLPDGRHFLFTIQSTPLNGNTPYSVAVGSLDSRTTRRLLAADSNALYAPPGYLLYLHGDTLMARPFDASRLEFTGQAVPIAVGRELAGALGYGRFAVSQTGVLAYRTGASVPTSQMVWLSRKGQKLGTIGQPDTYEDPVLSPDGTQLAVEVGEPGKRDIWVYDLKRGTASRLTFNPADDVNPVWSADGRRIFFSSTRRGHRDLYAKSANGLGNTQPVFVSRHQTMSLHDLSPDGRYAIYGAMGEGGLWILPLFGEGKPFVFVQNRFDPHSARFSPSDRYVAYTSAETGKDEVYVQTFPRHTGKWQVSKNGGSEPMWRGDGRELFYISPDKGAMAVEVNTNAAHFRAGTPKLLFKAQLGQNLLWRNRYVVSPDGQRFLMLVPAGQEKLSPITVVLNWPALLKKQ